jgi:DNA-binding LacI/PurR family transcriptional regulator
MKITIHDVARQAGVSTKTVSRVLNQQGEISSETRARVQAVIDALGYRPNILARSLVSRRSGMLGVVTWGLDHFAPSRIVVGIEQRASELGYSLFLQLMTHPTDTGAESILNTLADHRVEGIIWDIPEVGDNHAWLEQVTLDNLPPIVFITARARSGMDTVSVDNRRGAELAVQHLIEQGRRRIGLISGPAGWWETDERRAGWRSALEQAGLEAPQNHITAAAWTVESGDKALQRLLEQDQLIDGVFASSDDIALGALAAAARAGRYIPDNLALVGFDNIPQSAYFQPPLSTIDQPLARTGRTAVDLLLERIERRRGGSEAAGASSITLEPRLVVRASTGM